VYYEVDHKLARYDPAKRTVTITETSIPGDGLLRAASRPAPDGTILCFSKDGAVFAFHPETETVTDLCKAFVTGRLYITSCELSPGGRYLYYIPGAHGRSRAHGTALIQLDVENRTRKVITFLNEHLRREKDYNLGGTYGLALSTDGSMLFINWNGGPVDEKRNDFGTCAAMIVHVPASERRE
jgi:hypothetical protein